MNTTAILFCVFAFLATYRFGTTPASFFLILGLGFLGLSLPAADNLA